MAFFAGIAIVGLLLAVGPNLDLFPIYHLFFRIVPMFNFPRVSGRILAIAVVGLAMLVALVSLHCDSGRVDAPASSPRSFSRCWWRTSCRGRRRDSRHCR